MGPHFLSLCQIWCESVQKWLSYGRLTDFKMAAAAILDFWPMWILTVNLAAWSSFQHTYEIWCKYMQKIAEIWPKVRFSIWRPPPSWILRDVNFAGKTSYGTPFFCFYVIHWKMAVLWPFNWFQNGGRRHLGFLAYVNFDGKSGCRTHFQPMCQIQCKYTPKWPNYGQKCDFQYGTRRHLGFCGMSILPVKPVMGCLLYTSPSPRD